MKRIPYKFSNHHQVPSEVARECLLYTHGKQLYMRVSIEEAFEYWLIQLANQRKLRDPDIRVTYQDLADIIQNAYKTEFAKFMQAVERQLNDLPKSNNNS